MAARIPALITPSVLRWARETAGFDLAEAAKRLKRPQPELRAWERGESKPTISQLRKIATLYKRSLAMFYLPSPPKEPPPPKDFRRLPEDTRRDFSPLLRYFIRWLRNRQEWAAETIAQLGAPTPREFVGSATTEEDVPGLAGQIREVLGLSLDAQRSAPTVDDSLRLWLDACEAQGIFVFQTSAFDPKEMRGFALPHRYVPAVAVNSKDARAARVFTLLHEVAHLFLGAEGVSNLVIPTRAATEDQRLEVFCNAVAAEVLAPREVLESYPGLRELRGSSDVQEVNSAAEMVSQSFKISREVAVRRFSDLGYIAKAIYEKLRERYRREFDELKRRQAEEREGEEFKVSRARMVARDHGRAFARLVLEAYDQDLITSRDVAGLLSVKLKHLDRLRTEVSERGAATP